MYRDVMAIVLAGGRGSRLEPLTRDRAKPAVPFGGIYRIIDFTLSNCINSDIRKVLVLTQYKANSLSRHLDQGGSSSVASSVSTSKSSRLSNASPRCGIRVRPMRFTRTSTPLKRPRTRDTLILAGDHIYKMNYARMIDDHRHNRADLTIACLPVPRLQSREFGVMGVDDGRHVTSFLEKPIDPPGMPGQPNRVLASMGIYVFNTDAMYEHLFQDAARREASNHDFGRDIIPAMIAGGSRVFAYPFHDENRKEAAVLARRRAPSTPFQTGMDLIQIDPILDLYDRDWPIHAHQPALPASRVRAYRGRSPWCGVQLDRVPGSDRLGGPGLPQHHFARRAHQQLRPDRRRDPI